MSPSHRDPFPSSHRQSTSQRSQERQRPSGSGHANQRRPRSAEHSSPNADLGENPHSAAINRARKVIAQGKRREERCGNGSSPSRAQGADRSEDKAILMMAASTSGAFDMEHYSKFKTDLDRYLNDEEDDPFLLSC